MSKSFQDFLFDNNELVLFGGAARARGLDENYEPKLVLKEGDEIYHDDIRLGKVIGSNSEFVLYEDIRGEVKSVERSSVTEAKSGDKEAYQKFFKAALKKFGVDEPDQLKGDKEKEFYDYIDKNWKADKETD